MSASAFAERAASADAALKAYMSRTSCDCEDCLPDLLCDLMYWSDKCGLSFDQELLRGHFRHAADELAGGAS